MHKKYQYTQFTEFLTFSTRTVTASQSAGFRLSIAIVPPRGMKETSHIGLLCQHIVLYYVGEKLTTVTMRKHAVYINPSWDSRYLHTLLWNLMVGVLVSIVSAFTAAQIPMNIVPVCL